MYGKHGIEIRIWSVAQSNSQPWIRISYGTIKHVVDSNHNNTEVPADLPEEQASQSNVKVIAARSKAKAKTTRERNCRQTVCFLPVDPRDESHKDPEHIDFSVPRRARYVHSAWKKHQDAVFWVDIDL